MLKKIINALQDGNYHTIAQLAQQCHLSKETIQENLTKLIGYDVDIIRTKTDAYALREPLILLDQALLNNALNQYHLSLLLFETINSTNDYLIANASSVICVAEQQTQGRGRTDKIWYSPFAKNLYFSWRYPWPHNCSKSGLSLVVGLAVIEALQRYDIQGLQIKWPNDIRHQGNKLAGILIETMHQDVIIGIGLNVNLINAPAIDQPWTSLCKITGEYLDRNILLIAIIEQLLVYLQRLAMEGFNTFIAEWHRVDELQGKSITLTRSQMSKSITGIAQGIDAQGQLLLTLPSGIIQAWASGQSTLINQ